MSTTAGESAQPKRPQRRRQRRRTSKLSVGAAVGLAGGIVSLVGGIVTLFFLFLPGCQPKAQPDEGTASLGDVRVERGVTFGQYLARSGYPRGSLSAAYLARPGVLVRFHYEARGFRNKALPLESQLIDDGTHDLVGETERGVSIKPQTNDEARDWYVWRTVPKTRDTYHVVVTLYQPDGKVPVGTFDTDPFRGLAG